MSTYTSFSSKFPLSFNYHFSTLHFQFICVSLPGKWDACWHHIAESCIFNPLKISISLGWIYLISIYIKDYNWLGRIYSCYSVMFSNQFIHIFFILFGRESYRERHRETGRDRELPSVGSLPSRPQQQWLGLSEVWSWKCHLNGCRNSSFWSQHFWQRMKSLTTEAAYHMKIGSSFRHFIFYSSPCKCAGKAWEMA